jgi:hypothetical protein
MTDNADHFALRNFCFENRVRSVVAYHPANTGSLIPEMIELHGPRWERPTTVNTGPIFQGIDELALGSYLSLCPIHNGLLIPSVTLFGKLNSTRFAVGL